MSYSEADTYRFYDKDFYPNDHSMGLFESDEYYPNSYSFNVAQENENHSFDPSPLFEKVQNEEKTEKEKSNQVTESKKQILLLKIWNHFLFLIMKAKLKKKNYWVEKSKAILKKESMINLDLIIK